MKVHKKLAVLLASMLFSSFAGAESVRIATYNVQLWQDKFDEAKIIDWAKTQPQSAELDKLVKDERNQDNKDNWMIAQTILHPDLNPDILLIEEGPSQENLEAFNKRWLKNAYKTVTVFKTNSDRNQEVCMLAKEGFKVLETRDSYHKEIDSVKKDFITSDEKDRASVAQENRLFARGPTFVRIETPSGYKFWVGANHQKSKSGNNVDVSKWRDREAKRTHEIIVEIAKTGEDVVFGGDMNDELGFQEFEQEAGGDSIADIVGKDGEVVLATKPLVEKGEISFGGYFNERYRSLIDHFFVSKSLSDRIESIKVFKEGLAAGASDHYPVLLVIKSK